MIYADKLPTPEQFNRDWQDTIRCDLRNDSPRFGELEFPERPIVLEGEDFILEPIDSAPAADLSDVWAIVDVPTPYVWSANYSPVHFAQVLSAAAYYAAAPDRERFATVRTIGRGARRAIAALAWYAGRGLQRAAEACEPDCLLLS